MSDPAWVPATPGDAPALVAAMAAFYAEDHLVFAADAARATLLALLDAPALGRVFLLRDPAAPAGSVAGYLVLTLGFSLEFHGRFVLVDELYLTPPVRGRGLGRAALDTAAGWARAQGVATLRLEVNRANRRARDFYLAHGFADDARDLLTRRL